MRQQQQQNMRVVKSLVFHTPTKHVILAHESAHRRIQKTLANRYHLTITEYISFTNRKVCNLFGSDKIAFL